MVHPADACTGAGNSSLISHRAIMARVCFPGQHDKGPAHALLLAYVDESGNSGDPSRGATATYTLGCLLIDADARDEVKANYLLHDKGALRALALSRGQRTEIYERHMRLAEQLPAQAFAIVIVKARHRPTGQME